MTRYEIRDFDFVHEEWDGAPGMEEHFAIVDLVLPDEQHVFCGILRWRISKSDIFGGGYGRFLGAQCKRYLRFDIDKDGDWEYVPDEKMDERGIYNILEDGDVLSTALIEQIDKYLEEKLAQ